MYSVVDWALAVCVCKWTPRYYSIVTLLSSSSVYLILPRCCSQEKLHIGRRRRSFIPMVLIWHIDRLIYIPILIQSNSSKNCLVCVACVLCQFLTCGPAWIKGWDFSVLKQKSSEVQNGALKGDSELFDWWLVHWKFRCFWIHDKKSEVTFCALLIMESRHHHHSLHSCHLKTHQHSAHGGFERVSWEEWTDFSHSRILRP